MSKVKTAGKIPERCSIELSVHQNFSALKYVFQVPVTYQSVKLSHERETGEALSLSCI